MFVEINENGYKQGLEMLIVNIQDFKKEYFKGEKVIFIVN